MIQIAGTPFEQSNMWPGDLIERTIIKWMIDDPTVHSYSSMDELVFDVKLRKNIIASARAMNQSHVQFVVFAHSRCNAHYWQLTRLGGFQLRHDVNPADAIRDIFLNSSLYGFECATAMVIIYYDAVLSLIGDDLFNRLFQDIYLYSWHTDSDLGIEAIHTRHYLPGDIVYFNNPDFSPKHSEFRGENAVLLEDGTFFGHGIGIKTADEMISILNQVRKLGSQQSAYLTNLVTRLSFHHLMNLSMYERAYVTKYKHPVVHHNESSISHSYYLYLLTKLYNPMIYL
ncbi:protein-glutamine gamma-glutamyltransferase [bacterium LRH843]|nr:protein-glutamine gamma-glutamyltransferase [bacterium LRH843]